MKTFLCSIAIIIGIIAFGIVGLIYGWGLEPKSWPWILGSYVGAMVISGLTRLL